MEDKAVEKNKVVDYNNEIDQKKKVLIKSKAALYKFRGFVKFHIDDLFFPVYILVPELTEDAVGEDQFGTILVNVKAELFTLLPLKVKYVWVQQNDVAFKKEENLNVDMVKVNVWAKKNSNQADKDQVRADFEELELEISRSKTFYQETYTQTRVILDSIRQHGILPVEEVASIVDDITSSVSRNPNALLCMRGLQSADEYTYFHSINVGLLATVFAQYLGYNDDEVWDIGLAGVLHDIGKQRIPLKILNADRKLMDEEFAIMKLHPQAACEILKDVQGIGVGVLEAITCHHEKHDGSGYPYGLKGDEIHPYASLLTIVDVYDALTSIRPYKEAFSQNKTASIIYGQKGTSFRADITEKFICCFGVYPIGTLVRLSSGDFAMVYENNKDDLLFPKVLKLTRRYDTFLPNRATPIDLRTVKNEIRIVACEDCKTYGIELKQFLPTFRDGLKEQ